MRRDAAYLVAKPDGHLVHGTPAALAMLGMDAATLGSLKVTDLFPSGAPEGLGQRLDAAAEHEAWVSTKTDLLRADGSVVRVQLATMRAATGELVMRLETRPASASVRTSVHEILREWRQEERELVTTTPGTVEHLIANIDAKWLSFQYRQLVAAHADGPRDS
jgi:PAS domain S-box-containing protein